MDRSKHGQAGGSKSHNRGGQRNPLNSKKQENPLVRKSSSAHFLRHIFWRNLRKVLPGNLWSFMYSLRERVMYRGFLQKLSSNLKDDFPDQASTEILAELERLWKLHGAVGKAESGYGAHYAQLISRLREINPQNILEIGVAGGGSHRVWREIFPDAHIYGIDIDPTTLVRESRITTFVGDQLSSRSLHELKKKLPQHFELIVDDGWHQPEAGIKSLEAYLTLLGDNGFYVVEDIDFSKYGKIWMNVVRALPASYLARLFEIQTRASETVVGGSYGLLVIRKL